MKLAEVLGSLMEGKPISRESWERYMYYHEPENVFVYVYGPDDEMLSWRLDLEPKDIVADDWTIDEWDNDVVVESS